MKMINPSVSKIVEQNPFKKIEIVGRTCYKSNSEMTEETAKKFFKSLTSRGHTAMVEHATFVFKVDTKTYNRLYGCSKYFNFTNYNGRHLISANLRALNEVLCVELCNAVYNIDPMLIYNEEYGKIVEHFKFLIDSSKVKVIDPLKDLRDLSKEEFMAHVYFTFHFICDRGVSHEIVRHRPASYAQESTRYCNYIKEQFGGEITCIKPKWFDELPDISKYHFVKALESCEKEYMILIANGCSPQQARAVLPTDLKTEVIMTANAGEFEHFFNLRSKGTTGAPHPDIKVVADEACTMYEVERMLAIGE